MLGLILVINGLVEVTARELEAMQVDTTRVKVYTYNMHCLIVRAELIFFCDRRSNYFLKILSLVPPPMILLNYSPLFLYPFHMKSLWINFTLFQAPPSPTTVQRLPSKLHVAVSLPECPFRASMVAAYRHEGWQYCSGTPAQV